MRCYRKSARQLSAVILTALTAFLCFVVVALGQSDANNVFLPLISNGGIPIFATPVPIVTPTATQIATGTPATPLPTSTATLISTAPPTSAETPTATATATPSPTLTNTPMATATETATPLPAIFVLPNYTWFRDGIGGLHVVGQVENQDTREIWLPYVRANFFNTAGQLIATDLTTAAPKILSPGEKACFHVSINEPSDWDSFGLGSTATYGGLIMPWISLLGSTYSYNSAGQLEIVGQVRNDGAIGAKLVHIVGTIFDANNRVIDCSFSYVDTSTLAPGQDSWFFLRFFYHDPSLIVLRHLWVQGEFE